MKSENAIEVKGVKKKFKVYYDKSNQLKEKILFSKRNRYEERWVLNGLDFEVKKGEALALVGQNGCGKSTMLKLLTKIMYPDSGTVETQGRISCLIELGAGFHPDMSGRENIYINASIFGLSKKEIDERLSDIIAFSELEEYLDNPVRTYSSGMYMRLAFSVAINVDADILLIDEILAVGDANFQAKCFNRLREIKAAGKTIVLVTHDTGTVERFCDRAVWINNGQIAAIGDSRDVVDEYLCHMNGERINLLEREEKRKRELEEARRKEQEEAEAKAMAEQEKQLEAEELAMVRQENNPKRFGTKTAELTKVILRNSRGEETRLLKAGEAFSIEYHYIVHQKTEELIFGMGIDSLEGECIYGTNTMLAGVRVAQKDSGKLTFRCQDLNLLTGKYYLQVAICDVNNTPVDFCREYCEFNVVSASRNVGIVELNGQWEAE